MFAKLAGGVMPPSWQSIRRGTTIDSWLPLLDQILVKESVSPAAAPAAPSSATVASTSAPSIPTAST